MRRALCAGAAVLGAALLGAGPAEFMLCFHQDGGVFVERFQERCCESECPSDTGDACPDDQCHDLPLTVEGSAGLDVPGVTLGAPAPAPFLAEELPVQVDLLAVRDEPRHGSLDPPGPPPLDFLRTVVLRQ